MPPLGSMAQTWTSPPRIPGAKAEIRAQTTYPLPAPVAPTMSRCAPSSRSR